MPNLKILGGLAVLALVLGLVAAGFAGVRHYERLKADAASLAACVRLAGAPARAEAGCPVAVADALVRAGEAQACDRGLQGGAGGAFAVAQTCSAPVKRLVAELGARAAEVADRDRTLNELKADQSAAVDRAEARGLAQGRRDAHAAQVLDRAPRDSAGRVRCNAECLRGLDGPS